MFNTFADKISVSFDKAMLDYINYHINLTFKDDPPLTLILPILWTTKFTFLVEIRKVILSLFRQEKRTEALLESNLLGYPDPIE